MNKKEKWKYKINIGNRKEIDNLKMVRTHIHGGNLGHIPFGKVTRKL